MPEQDAPQIYLITPTEIDLGSFPDTLARVLDRVEVAYATAGGDGLLERARLWLRDRGGGTILFFRYF